MDTIFNGLGGWGKVGSLGAYGTLAGIDNLLVLFANVRYVAHVLFFVAFVTLPGICSR